MKKINYIFKGIICLSLLFACNDATDIEPEGSLVDDVTFETVGDLQLGLNGAYARYNPENEILFNSVFTDNCKPGVDNGGQEINFYNWALTAGDGNTTAIWNSNYQMINQSNRVLAAAANIVPDASEMEEYNNILGQAYALRALGHFSSHTYFTTDYKDPAALSIILSDRVPATNELLPRSTNQEIYDFIKSDLDMAETLISSSQTDNKYISQDFITGLRARVALFEGANYTNAINYAQDLIDSYTLASQFEYISMFLDTNNTEVIFKAARISGLVGGLWYFTGSAGPFMEASNSLYNALDPSDIRLPVLFNFNTNNNGPSDPANDYLLINKYPGNAQPFLNDIKVMRVSEMYLIKAEAQGRGNDLLGVALTLKALRDARLGSSTVLDVYANNTEALTAVLNERRLELAFEGQRYLDLKRLKDITGIGIFRDAIDCAEGGNCTMQPSDHRFTAPIPQVEINANPTITQNPGYGN